MVDCERGLERPKRALGLGRSVDRSTLDPEVRINLSIALSGARLDLGENELALAELEIAELNPSKVFEYSAPLFFAYGDTLEVLGRDVEAKKWWDLGERAVSAFAEKLVGDSEVVRVLEEIIIPAETTPTPKKESRDDDRGGRDGFRGGRDSDRGVRGSGFRGDRGPRDAGYRDGRDDSRRDERSDRPERSRDAGDSQAPRAPWKKPEE
jgi:hypothetical protein